MVSRLSATEVREGNRRDFDALVAGTLLEVWRIDDDATKKRYYLVTNRVDANTCEAVELHAEHRAAIAEGRPCPRTTLRHGDIGLMNILA